MLNKSSIYFTILHIFIICYLIVAILGISDNVMFVMHLISPFIVLITIYAALKAFRNATAIEESKGEYKHHHT